jgi:NADH-quinone oxidoreductase subunit E
MLTDVERKEIEAELAHAHDGRAACIDAMKIVQAHHGYVSDDHLRELSPILGLSEHELDSVATFYNLIFRQPVGRHVILICDSISCWIEGYDSIRDCLEQTLSIALGETTDDDRFTLLTIPCLGTCDKGPAMMIDDDLHTKLTAERVTMILEKYE